MKSDHNSMDVVDDGYQSSFPCPLENVTMLCTSDWYCSSIGDSNIYTDFFLDFSMEFNSSGILSLLSVCSSSLVDYEE